jgi:hypothetical protein
MRITERSIVDVSATSNEESNLYMYIQTLKKVYNKISNINPEKATKGH